MTPFAIDPEHDTICDVVRRWAEVQPDASAFIEEGRPQLTYAVLAAAMDAVTRDLQAAGLGRGDRIALIHRGGQPMAPLILGIIGAATLLPLNPNLTADELAVQLRQRRADALVLEADAPDAARAEAGAVRIPVLVPMPSGEGIAAPPNGASAGGAGGAAVHGPAQSGDTAMVLVTSGTTSEPKLVPFTHRLILARGLSENAFFERTTDDVCLCPQRLYYANGLNQMVSSLGCGSTLALAPSFTVETFFRYLKDFALTCVSASVPFLHRIHDSLDAFAGRGGEHALRYIRATSGYLAPDKADRLEAFFGAPILENYSSSETCRICCNPLPPKARKRGTVGPPSDCEVCIRALDGRILGPGEHGEVVVRSSRIIEGYEDNPEANAEAYIDGWWRTGDEGMFDEDGYLTLTGRIKEMINRGGEKVSPAEVDVALLSHPDVIEAATFPLRHPTLGEEVAAAIVQAPGAGLTDRILTKYLLGRLTGFKVPRRFFFVPEIPKSDVGKVQRYKLAEALGVSNEIGRHAATVPDRAPTALEAQLQGIWARALGIPRVGLDDNFFALGGDSLQAVDLFLSIEKELGRCLPRSILFEAGTVAQMARCIKEFSPSPCLVPIQPKRNQPPFFCVHDGTGEVLNYRELARLLGETQPFYGIQCRGLDREGVPFTRIEDMATHYVQEIRRVQQTGPYYLGGYSFGGRVAYVMAQQLRAAGEEIALLALLDSASGYGQMRVGWKDWFAHHRERMRSLPVVQLPAYLGVRATNLLGMVCRSIRIQFFCMAWGYFQRTNRTVPRFMRHPVPANDMIRRTYQPQPYDGDAVLFKAERYAWAHADSHEGWKRLVKGKLEIRPISGRHFEILYPPHVQTLAAELSDALRQAQGAIK